MTAISGSERRASRRAARKRSPIESLPFEALHNFLPPVQMLSEDQIEQIHHASMRILEEVGMRFMDAEALSIWEQAGAKVDHKTQHVWIDRNLLLPLIDKAPAEFILRARNPAKNIPIGGNKTVFATTSGVPCFLASRSSVFWSMFFGPRAGVQMPSPSLIKKFLNCHGSEVSIWGLLYPLKKLL